MTILEVCWQDTIPIRHQVLWPHKSPDFCKVKGDEEAKHYGAYIEGQLVSVASVYINGGKARLRKFATLSDFQRRGIGSQLISHVIERLKSEQVSYFWCDARSSALDFYMRFGMSPFGDKFYKSDISYFKMSVQLSSQTPNMTNDHGN